MPLLSEAPRPWWSEWAWLLILLGVLLCCYGWCGVLAAATLRSGSRPVERLRGWLAAIQGRMAVRKSHLAVLEAHHTQPRAVRAMSRAAGKNARTADFVRPDHMARGPQIRRASCDGSSLQAADGGGVDTQQRRVRSMLGGNGVWRGRRGASVDGALSRTTGHLLVVGSDGQMRQRAEVAACDSFDACSLSPMASSNDSRPLLPRTVLVSSTALEGAARSAVMGVSDGQDGTDSHLLALEEVSGGILERPLLEAARQHLRTLHATGPRQSPAPSRSVAVVPADPPSPHPPDDDNGADCQREGETDAAASSTTDSTATVLATTASGGAERYMQHEGEGVARAYAGAAVGAVHKGGAGVVVAGQPESMAREAASARGRGTNEVRVASAEPVPPPAGVGATAAARRGSHPVQTVAHEGGQQGHADIVAQQVESQGDPGRAPVVGGLRARFSAAPAQQAPGRAGGHGAVQLQPEASDSAATAGEVQVHSRPGAAGTDIQTVERDSVVTSGRDIGHSSDGRPLGVVGEQGSRRSRAGISVEHTAGTQDASGGTYGWRGGVQHGADGATAVAAGGARRRGGGISEIQPAERPSESLLFEILGSRQRSPYSQAGSYSHTVPQSELDVHGRNLRASRVRRTHSYAAVDAQVLRSFLVTLETWVHLLWFGMREWTGMEELRRPTNLVALQAD